MIAEAIDTAYTIGAAILAWIAVAAAVVTVCLFTTILIGAWTWKTVRKHLSGPSWARGRLRARIHAHRARKRHSKPTETHTYREAA